MTSESHKETKFQVTSCHDVDLEVIVIHYNELKKCEERTSPEVERAYCQVPPPATRHTCPRMLLQNLEAQNPDALRDVQPNRGSRTLMHQSTLVKGQLFFSPTTSSLLIIAAPDS